MLSSLSPRIYSHCSSHSLSLVLFVLQCALLWLFVRIEKYIFYCSTIYWLIPFQLYPICAFSKVNGVPLPDSLFGTTHTRLTLREKLGKFSLNIGVCVFCRHFECICSLVSSSQVPFISSPSGAAPADGIRFLATGGRNSILSHDSFWSSPASFQTHTAHVQNFCHPHSFSSCRIKDDSGESIDRRQIKFIPDGKTSTCRIFTDIVGTSFRSDYLFFFLLTLSSLTGSSFLELSLKMPGISERKKKNGRLIFVLFVF
jgi:hypothetical protein